mmetsp:Transcript_17825/g.32267  ORF Transcript_17825/g.32267 Transcript_17825/m.32267 type:complete len:205 (-) Transcript_17825:33-647(-)
MWNGKSHYDTLGVTKLATKEEIKAAYRKLCMETHPDRVGSSNAAKKTINLERFKQISAAHSVLADDRQRKHYDFDLSENERFGFQRRKPSDSTGWSANARGPHGRKSNASHHMSFLDGIFKPRNLLVGVVLGFTAVSLVRGFLRDDEAEATDKQTRTGMTHAVEAWKNPKTGQWEQPAPWDATYQRLRPKLELIPRHQVRPRQP